MRYVQVNVVTDLYPYSRKSQEKTLYRIAGKAKAFYVYPGVPPGDDKIPLTDKTFFLNFNTRKIIIGKTGGNNGSIQSGFYFT